jgi:hypothetical protein
LCQRKSVCILQVVHDRAYQRTVSSSSAWTYRHGWSWLLSPQRPKILQKSPRVKKALSKWCKQCRTS